MYRLILTGSMGVAMSELLTSIPGDIPGLLRRGSPVRVQTISMVVSALPVDGIGGWLADDGFRCSWPISVPVLLDLTDATGRAHAAWWAEASAMGHGSSLVRELDYQAHMEVVRLAERGLPMTPTQIDTLARLVLRLAGRS